MKRRAGTEQIYRSSCQKGGLLAPSTDLTKLQDRKDDLQEGLQHFDGSRSCWMVPSRRLTVLSNDEDETGDSIVLTSILEEREQMGM